ncbi:type I glyceraldehyde-3-phosphate dehydrogenase [bacterium]|nr:type I glyceraldehyde-3-phosphate dehydrogenase [bacterium]
MVTRVAINGFGRIGRNVFKVIESRDDIEVVAINDLTSPSILAHLLKYDSVHGRFQGTISSDETSITVNDKKIDVSSIRSPIDLPWASLNVDVVIESTGIFTSATSAKGGYNDHLTAGAKKVILTVPAKDEIKTVVLGVNTDEISEDINVYSNASCTTNCLAPIAKILNDNFKIKKGYMTTVHSYTSDQRILDFPHQDLRRARSAAMSIIPTSTGAAKAVSLVIPDLKGKLDGIAMRVPTPDGSVVDLVCEVEIETTKDEVNALIKKAASGSMKGIVEYVDEPIVSCDVIGNPHSSVFDSLLTMVDGKMVKIISWYDNEIGYSSRVVDLVSKISPSKVTG